MQRACDYVERRVTAEFENRSAKKLCVNVMVLRTMEKFEP